MNQSKIDWIPLQYAVDKLNNRKWFWSGGAQDAYKLKYLTLNIDTRDNHCTIFNQDGECVAASKDELDALFERLDQETGLLTFQQAKKITGVK